MTKTATYIIGGTKSVPKRKGDVMMQNLSRPPAEPDRDAAGTA